MRKHIQFVALFSFLATAVLGQGKLTVTDLKPAYPDYHFPEVSMPGNPRAAEKININLQLAYLEHLPGIYKLHPFENVIYDKEGRRGSMQLDSWEKLNSPSNILSLCISGDATGAYSENFSAYHNFDLRNGNPIFLKNIIRKDRLTQLEKILNQKVKKTISDYLAHIGKELKKPGLKKDDLSLLNEQTEMYDECLSDIEGSNINYYQHYFSRDSITFVRERCSNHARRALDDLDKYYISFSYKDIASYLSPLGQALLSGSKEKILSASPDGQIFKGTIEGKYPVKVADQ